MDEKEDEKDKYMENYRSKESNICLEKSKSLVPMLHLQVFGSF